MFLYKSIYSESLFNTLYIDVKPKCEKNFLQAKQTGTKNALFFLSRAPTHHSFTFNSRFLYKLKRKVLGFYIFNSIPFLLKFP